MTSVMYRIGGTKFKINDLTQVRTFDLATAGKNKKSEVIQNYIHFAIQQDIAITELERYKTKREKDTSEHKVPRCFSSFFKAISPSLLGVSKTDKLEAAEKITDWLKASKKESSPPLTLTPKDIKALTDGDLGKTIAKIAKTDPVFKVAFNNAKAHPNCMHRSLTKP